MNRIASVPAAGLLGILALLGLAAAPLPAAAQTGNVKPAAPMSLPRRGHTATLLTSGQVWVAGGIVNNGLTTTAATQRYDVVSNTWQSAGDLRTAGLYSLIISALCMTLIVALNVWTRRRGSPAGRR